MTKKFYEKKEKNYMENNGVEKLKTKLSIIDNYSVWKLERNYCVIIYED